MRVADDGRNSAVLKTPQTEAMMSAVCDLPEEPIKRTPFWLRIVGRPARRQWVWTWMGWGASDGYWNYIP
jgi:hypothetical protein